MAVVAVIANYVEDIGSQAVTEKYLQALRFYANVDCIVIPALTEGYDRASLERVMANVDGLFLTGGVSNVHPSFYSEDVIPNTGPYDNRRDRTVFDALAYCVKKRIPVLGVCRGMQEINCFFGGTLYQNLEKSGFSSIHRAIANIPQNDKYYPRHNVIVQPGSWLASKLQLEMTLEVRVNSLHQQGIQRVGERLVVEAVCDDGLVEAIKLDSTHFVYGVQWHAEWWLEKNYVNRLLFQYFGSVCAGNGDSKVESVGKYGNELCFESRSDSFIDSHRENVSKLLSE